MLVISNIDEGNLQLTETMKSKAYNLDNRCFIDLSKISTTLSCAYSPPLKNSMPFLSLSVLGWNLIQVSAEIVSIALWVTSFAYCERLFALFIIQLIGSPIVVKM